MESNISYVNGNILECNSDVITNAVNIRGVMGAGLALAFARDYPDMYEAYQEVCRNQELKIGILHTWEIPNPKPKRANWIVNFPTMDYPGEFTQVRTLYLGFASLIGFIEENAINSIALPALGCGIGRLPWDTFKAIVEVFAQAVPHVKVIVYLPH